MSGCDERRSPVLMLWTGDIKCQGVGAVLRLPRLAAGRSSERGSSTQCGYWATAERLPFLQHKRLHTSTMATSVAGSERLPARCT
jgi:hypothetical protein